MCYIFDEPPLYALSEVPPNTMTHSLYALKAYLAAQPCSESSSLSPLCPGFQWSGCSDNLSYGVAFSQTFVDEQERAKGLSAGRPLMNIHNNEAGRKVGRLAATP